MSREKLLPRILPEHLDRALHDFRLCAAHIGQQSFRGKQRAQSAQSDRMIAITGVASTTTGCLAPHRPDLPCPSSIAPRMRAAPASPRDRSPQSVPQISSSERQSQRSANQARSDDCDLPNRHKEGI